MRHRNVNFLNFGAISQLGLFIHQIIIALGDQGKPINNPRIYTLQELFCPLILLIRRRGIITKQCT